MPLTAAVATAAFVLSVLLAAQGCGLASLASGQLELLNGQVRLDRAIARETDPMRRALLEEVPAIRAFAREEVGLSPGKTYEGYYATERKGLTFVITASEQLALVPYTWWYPIAGEVEYRSFWEEVDAKREAAGLEREGYDTWISASRAYSTLGYLRDPVITTMMRNGLPAFVEVLIHEMSHARLYVAGQTDWNEALASFVGERGVERYFESPRFAGTPYPAQIQARRGRRKIFDEQIAAASAELERLYASSASRETKLRERGKVFDRLGALLQALYPEEDPAQWRMNNARLLHFRRYSANDDLLAQMWQESGGRFRPFWRLAERHAATLE
jgi:predicted aminopeptidase